MKETSKPRDQRTLSLTPDMKVNEVLELWPQTLTTFIKMGFAPLAHKMIRHTLAKNISLRQAARFRNIDLNILLLNLQTTIANPTASNESFIDADRLRFDENTIPNLSGDITILGLIPCPIRNILIEEFDAYIQREYSSRGIKVAWWFAAEGPGLTDIKIYLKSTIKSAQYSSFPDFFFAVGTELFLHEEYGRKLYEKSIFRAMGQPTQARRELSALEDPNGKLTLQFAVLFSFYVWPDKLGKRPLPKTWFDLTDPVYQGQIVIPSLNLPVIPDFLAALYYYLGDSLFIKFCQNVSFAQHPAQSSARKSRQREPGIYISPIHFSRIIKSADGRHILPEDGLVAVPAYFACTLEDQKTSLKLADYFLSQPLLEKYQRCGSFIPNNMNVPTAIPLGRLITRPWNSLLGNIPDLIHKQLLRNFKLEVTT